MNPAAIILSVLVAAGFSLPPDAVAKAHCVDGGAQEARLSGSDEGTPRFSPAFFGRAMTLNASADGLDGGTLPISIEAICGLPRSLDNQAATLAGGDGVALVTTRTSVWKDNRRLPPAAKLLELDGADTVTVRARMIQRPAWRTDEDGEPVPTFRAARILITD